MKDAEDEAFDELAKRQGMWGGGFMAKRAMAADKLVEDLAVYGTSWSKNGERIDPMSVYLDEPAQEPVGMLHIERLDKWLDASLKERKQREWVGLTDEEREGIAQDYSLTGLGYQSPFKAIEAMLKEKNT